MIPILKGWQKLVIAWPCAFMMWWASTPTYRGTETPQLKSANSLRGRQADSNPTSPPGDSVVVAGKRVGRLSLGDAETRITEMFPKATTGQSSRPAECGTEYIVALLRDVGHPGFLRIFSKEGKIAEIEASGDRFHTPEGIASKSPPEDIRLHYKGVKSYLFLHCCDESLNEGPLILWTVNGEGIAFSFTYPAKGNRKLLTSSLIIFNPKATFCEQDTIVQNPDQWRELAPYSLGESTDVAQAFGGLSRMLSAP